MKNLVLIAATLCFSVAAFAQKSQIRTAKNYLGEKNYEKAKTAIETAIADESTKDDPDAWYVRGVIYLALQMEPANESKDLYSEAGRSFRKAIALKPDFQKEDMDNKLYAVAIYNFNSGIAAFEKGAHEQAYKNFGEVIDIHSLESGKRFPAKSWSRFDTMARQANLYKGYSAYYNKRLDESLPLLQAAKNDPVVMDANVYIMLADIYIAKEDDAALMSALSEGRKAYPTEKVLVVRELNYYISHNKTAELISKLEDAIKLDPNNADLVFRLGIAYDVMANPKDKSGKDLPKPANYEELFTKAETAYKTAVTASPDKADVNYNTGALYFNRAVLVNDKMNAIAGTSAAEMKKYDALKAEREDWFNKALPYLDKTISLDDPIAAQLSGEDKDNYMAALVAAKEIYAKQNKLEKSAELKKKLDAVNK